MEVWAPFKILTFLFLYGSTLSVQITLKPAFCSGSSSSWCPWITHRWKISAVSIILSCSPILSHRAACSSLGKPVTIRSTKVEQKSFSFFNHALNSSPKFHRSAYCSQHFSSSSPLWSISSQDRMIKPFKPNWNLLYNNWVSLPGKLFAGASSNLLSATNWIPASVVLETMKRKSGFSASAIYAALSVYGLTHLEITSMCVCSLTTWPLSIPLKNRLYSQFCFSSISHIPFSIGCTITTEPSNKFWSFNFWKK